MKKSIVSLSLLLMMVLVITVCGGCAANKDGTDAEASPDVTAEPTPEAGFDYSEGISGNGHWEDVTALDLVELCAYTGISVPAEVHEIPDESVQSKIDAILGGYATEEQVTDRAVADGDTVNIDYVGRVDGTAFDGGSTGGQGADVTIGVTQYIDDFLEQLIGHSPGESFDIEVTFPEDYHAEDLQGKDAVFATTVNYIVNTVTPELTDDFVAENLSADYGWNTIAEMREEIGTEMQRSAVIDFVQNYIVENTTVQSVPESMIAYQEKTMLAFYRNYAASYQMELNDFLNTYMDGTTTDELIEQNLANNTQTATLGLVLQAVAEDAGISVTGDDVAAYFEKYMGSGDYSAYEESRGMPYLKLIVLQESVLDHLMDNAVME